MNILNILKYISEVIVPIIALIVSIIALIKSNKISNIEKQLNEYDLKLKQHELEEIEEEKKAFVELRVIHPTSKQWKVKIWNSGTAKAYDVDYEIPKDSNIILQKEVTPFEELKPGCSFEEYVIMYPGCSRKFKYKVTWKDDNGKTYINEQYISW